jgi:hypothetical protein
MSKAVRTWSILVLLILGGASHAAAQDAFAGVWRAGNDPYYLWMARTGTTSTPSGRR